MRAKAIHILKLLSVPIILLAIYFVVMLVWRLLDLPVDDELIAIARDAFNKYGLWIVFVAALVEGFLLLGQYFPGGLIIFLGVISAGKDISRAVEVVSIVSVAFIIAYTLNYLVGKYGWYHILVKFGLKHSLESSKEKLTKHGLSAVIFSYWEPNLASITATAAGILQIPFYKFQAFSIVGVIIWNIFWGALVFTLGEAALDIIGLKYVLIVFAVWVLVILIKYFYQKRVSLP